MSPPEIPSRDVVQAVCKSMECETNGLAYNDRVWIKYGVTVRLAEAAIQRYVYDYADPSIVRIPQVFDAFSIPREYGSFMTYIVMENVKDDDYVNYIKRHPETAEQTLDAIAKAVRHIWDIPLPLDASPGPFERDFALDRFFSAIGADEPFNNLKELEDWVNSQLEQGGYPHRITLEGEPLFICHCDLTQFNIKVGDRITILDWGFAGIWPRAFEEFGLVHQFNLLGQNFAKALHRQLFGVKFSKSMLPLSLASRFHQFGC